jgi:DNA-binding NarL/FixJ family response regulator
VSNVAGLPPEAKIEHALAAPLPALQVSIIELVGEAPLQRDFPHADVYVAPCDLSRNDSIRRVESTSRRLASPLVLVIGDRAKAREMKAILRAGAAGLVRERDLGTSLLATARAVAGGQLVVPRELGRQIERPALSRRQKQVLGLVVMGLSNGEIAAELHLSEHTVKCHLYASFRKLGVNSRDEAVTLILDPDEGLGTGILTISGDEQKVGGRSTDGRAG